MNTTFHDWLFRLRSCWLWTPCLQNGGTVFLRNVDDSLQHCTM